MIAEKLRKAALQAAIQGKLTQQLPEDGDARDLLRDIQQEKARLVKEGKLKKEKPLPPITEDEIPFDLPENWCWVRLGDIAEYRKGPFGSSLTKSMFIPDGDDAIKVYEQKNAIQKDEIIGKYFIQKSYFDNKMRSFEVGGGDIIISCAGTIGESFILPANTRIGIINQALMRVRTFLTLNQRYFLIIFDYAIHKKEAIGKGSAIKNIPPFEILKKLVVPMPPIPEQRRIINQLEEMFVEIEKLDADESKLEALQKAFPQQLKSAILQAAIQGKLTEQLPEDGDARDLLKEIQQEKASLVKAGKFKKEKNLPPITEDEIPFDIPENWVWVRLGSILVGNIGGGTPSKSKSEYWNGSIPWASVKDLPKDEIILENTKDFITELGLHNSSSNLIKKGNIIVCTRMGLGKIVITNFDVAINQDLRALITSEFINKRYLLYFYKTRVIEGQGLTVKGITVDQLESLVFPLPPLAEQQRIVERLEELLLLCERLE